MDILVNNAGGPPSLPFLEISEEHWQAAFQLTLMGAVTLIKEVIPVMQARKFGRIINLTSVAVKQPILGLILSNALRTGLVGLAKTLATIYAPDNILINNVCPGYTLTERVRELSEVIARRQQKRSSKAGKRRSPWGAWGNRKNWRTWWFFWPRSGPATSPGPRSKWMGDIVGG